MIRVSRFKMAAIVAIVLSTSILLASCAIFSKPTPALPPPVLPPLPPLSPVPIQASEVGEMTAGTICLSVSQEFTEVVEPDEDGESILPIADPIKALLTELGWQVVEGEGECEATLTVIVEGRPLGARYVGDDYCYTGGGGDSLFN